MTQPITIVRFNRIAADRRADGSRAVAAFDAVLCGIRFAGCVVVERPDRSLVAEPPAAKTRSGKERVVRIVDPDLDREFQTTALAAYHTISQGEDHAI